NGIVVRRYLNRMAVRVGQENGKCDSRIFGTVKWNFHYLECIDRQLKIVLRHAEGEMLNRDFVVEVVNGLCIGAVHKTQLHPVALNHPGASKFVIKLKSKDLRIPCE